MKRLIVGVFFMIAALAWGAPTPGMADESAEERRVTDAVRAIAARQVRADPQSIDVEKLLSEQGFTEADAVFLVSETEDAFGVTFVQGDLADTTSDLMKTLTVRRLAKVVLQKLRRPSAWRTAEDAFA
jgi:acyl carrier protein